MFKFTDQQQENKFNKDFDNHIKSFSKLSPKKKTQAINCTLKMFLTQQSNSRLVKANFFKTENMSYEEFMSYKYLNYIHKAELYEFTLYEISIFNPSFAENKN